MISMVLLLVAGLAPPILIAWGFKVFIWKDRPPADRLTLRLFAVILLVGSAAVPGLVVVSYAERWHSERVIRNWCAEHGHRLVSLTPASIAGGRGSRRWSAIDPWRAYVATRDDGHRLHLLHGDAFWGRLSRRVDLIQTK